MQIRDRVIELRRVQASELRPNPRNWRMHPQPQRDAMRDALAELGYADALLARQLPDGSLELIDGHLRAETTPDHAVPVLVLDLDDAESAKLLATLDPLAGLAVPDRDVLAELAVQVDLQGEALAKMLDDLLATPGHAQTNPAEPPPRTGPPHEVNVPEAFQVVVECNDEQHQRTVFERLRRDGLRCRLLTL